MVHMVHMVHMVMMMMMMDGDVVMMVWTRWIEHSVAAPRVEFTHAVFDLLLTPDAVVTTIVIMMATQVM